MRTKPPYLLSRINGVQNFAALCYNSRLIVNYFQIVRFDRWCSEFSQLFVKLSGHCEVSFSRILSNAVHNFSNNLLSFLLVYDLYFCFVRVYVYCVNEDDSNVIAHPCITLFLLFVSLRQFSARHNYKKKLYFPVIFTEFPMEILNRREIFRIRQPCLFTLMSPS